MDLSLSLTEISIRDFRSIPFFETEGLGALTLFIGPNGIGKTNVVEAIQLVTSAESFRKPQWKEVVRFGEESTRVMARVTGPQRDLVVALRAGGNQRSYTINGNKKTIAEVKGILPAVAFTPDDLRLAKGPGERRRASLDSLGGQISGTYYELRSTYEKTIRQKNALLQSPDFDLGLIGPWNEQIAALGAVLVSHRLNLFNAFLENIQEVFSALAKGWTLDLTYLPSWAPDPLPAKSLVSADEAKEKILAALEDAREQEIAAQRASIGPHRDDIVVFLNGVDARKFASQGQQRLIALAWKLAALKTIELIEHKRPLLLLDDVLSEFDREHRNVLVSYLLDGPQTFITATEASAIDDRIIEAARIFDLGKRNEAQ